MKRYSITIVVLLLCALFSSGTSNGQNIGNPPVVNWTSQIGGDGEEVITDHVADNSGNFFCTGSYSGSFTLGSFSASSLGLSDFFLAKVDAGGNPLWLATATSAANSHMNAAAVCRDDQDNLYVTGYYEGLSADFSGTVINKMGISDAFVAKYNSGGTLQYVFSIGNVGESRRGLDIEVDNSGNLYVIVSQYNANNALVGSMLFKYNSSGVVDWFKTSISTYSDIVLGDAFYMLTGTLRNAGEVFGATFLDPTTSDAFIARADLAGDYSWASMITHINTAGFSGATSIAVDSQENAYISGYFRRDLIAGNASLTAGGSGYSSFLAKFDASGLCLWAVKPQDNTLNNASPFMAKVFLYNNGFPILSGVCATTITWETTSLTNTSYYLASFDSSGQLLWLRPQFAAVIASSTSATNSILQSGTFKGNGVLKEYDSTYLNTLLSIGTTGSSGKGYIYDIVADSDGNNYSLAFSENPIADFNNVSQYFILKQSPDGDFLWALPVVGGRLDGGYTKHCFSIDHNNCILVQGVFDSLMTIGTVQLQSPAVRKNNFLAKVNPSGNVLWAKVLSADGSISGNAVTTDNGNNVIISGSFNGELLVDGNSMTATNDVYIVKFNAAGSYQWNAIAGGSEFEYCGFVSCDALNNIYLSGEFLSRDIMLGAFSMNLTEEDGDVILAKYSQDGICQWAYAYGGSETENGRYSAWPSIISALPDGQTYLYGWTGKDNYFGSDTLISPYNYNFFVARFSSTGIPIWSRIIKEKSYDFNGSMDVDANGNCYFTATFKDTLYFENQMVVPTGKSNLFVAKYSAQGDVGWVKTFEGTHSCINSFTNRLAAIAVFDSNSIYIGGHFNNGLSFESSAWQASAYNGFVTLLGDDITTGLDNVPESKTDFLLYPNPGIGYYTLLKPASVGDEDIEYTVYDILGNKVFQDRSGHKGPLVFDFHSLSPGNYYLRIKSNTVSAVLKFMKIQ